MTNRIPRKSAVHIVACIAVGFWVLLFATLTWQHLLEPNPATSEVSQPVPFAYIAASGEDVWHALPAGH
jgi:hypothetical protein